MSKKQAQIAGKLMAMFVIVGHRCLHLLCLKARHQY